MFKICTVGCGNVSTGSHGPGIKKYAEETPDTTLAACCDLDREKAQNYSRKFGFKKFYCDIDEMLDAEHPDAVCLISPYILTSKLAVQILSKGYPLIMEKPPGVSVAECRDIINASKKYNAPAQVAFNRRYAPCSRMLRQEVQKYQPEDIQYVKCTFRRCNRINEDFPATSIHGIDAMRFFCGGDYQEIEFRYRAIPGGTDAWNVDMYCTMTSGIHAQLSFYPGLGNNIETYELGTLNRTAFCDMNSHFCITEKHETETIDCSDPEHFIARGIFGENKMFFDDIRNNGKLSEGGIEDSLQSVLIADCLRERSDYFKLSE